LDEISPLQQAEGKMGSSPGKSFFLIQGVSRI
jgi:hypothetical protein